MPSIKPAFTLSASVNFTFWLLVRAIAILDDGKQREKERLRTIEKHRTMELRRKAPAPRP